MNRRQKSVSRRLRILVHVTALCCLQRRAKALLIVQRELRRGELSPRFFSELFIHLSLFLGYPTMLDGLESVAAATPHRTTFSLKMHSATARSLGKHVLERVYGRQTSKLLRHLDGLYPGLGHRITQDAYGLIMNRSGLSLPERELANVVVLFIHGFDRQLYSHLRGALRVGVDKRTLKSVIRTAAHLAGKTSKRTFSAIGKLTVD